MLKSCSSSEMRWHHFKLHSEVELFPSSWINWAGQRKVKPKWKLPLTVSIRCRFILQFTLYCIFSFSSLLLTTLNVLNIFWWFWRTGLWLLWTIALRPLHAHITYYVSTIVLQLTDSSFDVNDNRNHLCWRVWLLLYMWKSHLCWFVNLKGWPHKKRNWEKYAISSCSRWNITCCLYESLCSLSLLRLNKYWKETDHGKSCTVFIVFCSLNYLTVFLSAT